MFSPLKKVSARNPQVFNKLFIASVFILVGLWLACWLVNSASVQAQAEDSGVELTIARPAVNLRAGPGTNYAIMTVGKQGEVYPVTGTNQARTWYQITLADGRPAWISASLTTTAGDIDMLPVVDAPPTAPVSAPATATPVGAPASTITLHGGAFSGRLLYSVANMDAKRWELWEYDFGSGVNTKVNDWRTEIDVSKDGAQIVYYAWPPSVGAKIGIWIMDADFSNTRLVIAGGAYPSFSPGGDRLVANSGDVLYVLKTDGTDLRGLTKGEYPAWSPVSNQIAHRACVGGSCGLWLIDADSTNPDARTHITTGGSDGQPAWSPDGKRIAYISKEDGNFEIYVIGADGSNKIRLTSDPASDGLPVWSPDGQWIAFRSDRGGKWAIYVARPDGSNVQKVIDADVLPLWFFEKMDWR